MSNLLENTIKVLGIEINNVSLSEILEYLKKRLEVNSKQLTVNSKIIQVATVNPEFLMLAREKPDFEKTLNQAQIRLADGVGIILAAKLSGKSIKERITGLQLTKKLSEMAAKEGLMVGLIGGGPQVAVKCGECLEKRYPRLKWWGDEGAQIQKSKIKDQNVIQNSKYNAVSKLQITNYKFLETNSSQLYNFEKLIEKINSTRTSILFCAFGAPKQEFFIAELKKHQDKLYQPLVAVGVGGVFDEITGLVPPAPAVVEQIGLKWLWRLLHEPWRWKRQLKLISFIYSVVLSPIR